MSKIEWTEATWNPIAGCSVVSPGCTNCYAMRQAHRLASNPATPHYAGTTQMSRGGPVWTGKIGVAPDKVLTAPLLRRKPTTYFVNSMSDLFHEAVPDEVIDRVFAVMALCPQHRFQILTKRPDRMREYFAVRTGGDPWAEAADHIADLLGLIDHPAVLQPEAIPLPNLWLGTSVEDQRRADERIPHLLATPAAVRFLSCEPLVGPVDLKRIQYGTSGTRHLDALDPRGIRGGSAWEGEELPPEAPRRAVDWVIVGGESGPGARPMHPDWARTIRDQCSSARVPFFFKQWGAWASARPAPAGTPGRFAIASKGADSAFWPASVTVTDQYPRQINLFGGATVLELVGKRAAGRTLDGRLWSEVPA